MLRSVKRSQMVLVRLKGKSKTVYLVPTINLMKYFSGANKDGIEGGQISVSQITGNNVFCRFLE